MNENPDGNTQVGELGYFLSIAKGTAGIRRRTKAERVLMRGLVRKLPEFDPEWPDDVKDGWFVCFARLWESGATPSDTFPA